MSTDDKAMSGPDLSAGVPFAELAEGTPLLGHAAGEPVVLVRLGDEVLAVGATCTHYGAPLADGLIAFEGIRCPWHHACFDLRTGEALRAPALNSVPTYDVERVGGLVRVAGRRGDRPAERRTGAPSSVVIVGAGAAGNAAAEAAAPGGLCADASR